MSKKVLVVDDSKTIRQQAQFVLNKAGFEVVAAENGQDGLDKLAGDSSIALVLADVNMPVMNGIEMITKIKDQSA